MDWNARWIEGDTPWDKGAPAPPLLEFLKSDEGSHLSGADVLVPGCGSGHDVRALAEHGAKPIGMDVSKKALEYAGSFQAVGNETYVLGDFLEWTDGSYDAIWEHTCFCAIDPARRRDYAEAAARLIRPGGHLIGVFFLNPWDPGEEEQGPPFGATREEIQAYFGTRFALKSEKIPETAYAGREGREWLVRFERLPDKA